MNRSLAAVCCALCLGSSFSAEAFCGFYVSGSGENLFNNATQVVMMREGTRTVLAMQNNYQGPPEAFAMVVPVPVILQKENVKTLSKAIIEKVDRLDSPRLVEYWERDPCFVPPKYEERVMKMSKPPMVPQARGAANDDYGVKVEAQFTVGEYEIVILSAKDAFGLDRWLRDNKYKIPEGAEPLFRPYIQQGMKFFVAKVDPKKVQFSNGQANLSPLRFHYDSEQFALPVRLGLVNAKDAQDLIVHILARGQRYEVANFPNVTIPTNIDLKESAKARFPQFYAALFDLTQENTPKAVVTEYAWDSGTCDPCPAPPLHAGDLQSLGVDVLGANQGARGMFVLTRLHARYDKSSLGEDLVFKAAPPIAGGREHLSSGGQLEQGSVSYDTNNFQARYAIRYPWQGEIKCRSPRRGVWGGPPHGQESKPVAALDTAFVERKTSLAQELVESPVAELKLAGTKPHAGQLPAAAMKQKAEKPKGITDKLKEFIQD
jgi:hypothetical protein